MLGKHAPGKTGLKNFLPGHTQRIPGCRPREVAFCGELVSSAHIGTSFSCSEVIPFSEKEEDIQAANRVDILLNRLFIEPALGMGYPREHFKFLEKLEFHNKSWKYVRK